VLLLRVFPVLPIGVIKNDDSPWAACLSVINLRCLEEVIRRILTFFDWFGSLKYYVNVTLTATSATNVFTTLLLLMTPVSCADCNESCVMLTARRSVTTGWGCTNCRILRLMTVCGTTIARRHIETGWMAKPTSVSCACVTRRPGSEIILARGSFTTLARKTAVAHLFTSCFL